jgi:glycosyltransferase involved in cell wall biosynthesis
MKVSLVLRTKNEEEGMRSLQRLLLEQTRPVDEIIVVDSGSSDGTLSVAKEMGATIVEIKSEEFTFGRALNLGVEQATGDVIVGLSAHCLPKDHRWIELLLQPFEDQTVAGVYGRQLPFSDASVIERRGLREAYPLRDTPVDVQHAMFSNAHSAFRRDAWENVRFDEELSGSEDIDWAGRVLEDGGRIVYQPLSEVFHSHKETLKGVRTRFYREMLALRQFENPHVKSFGVIGALLRWVKASVLDYFFLFTTFISVPYFLKWLVRIPVFRAGAYYGQYQAIRDSNR